MKKGDKYKCFERGAYYTVLKFDAETITVKLQHYPFFEATYSHTEFNKRFYKP